MLKPADITKPLNLPDVALETIMRDGKPYVLDPVRRRFVRLLPEEKVRQHVLAYLTGTLGVPAGLIAVEKGFEFNDMPRRADILVHDRTGAPLILVECKSPDIALTQAVFDQVGRYNTVVGARYVLVSNGLQHYCFHVADRASEPAFVSELAEFNELVES